MRSQQILGVIGFIFWTAAATAQPLASIAVEPQNVPRLHVLDGVVEAVSQGTLSAQTSGRVVSIAVDVDDVVVKDAVVLKIDDIRQRAALEQAQASLAEARARRDEAESEHRRVDDLRKRNLASQADLDRVEAALKAARARLEAAQAGLASAREELDRTVVTAPYTGVVTERHVELGETVSPGMPLLSGLSLEQLRVVVHVPQRLVGAVRNAHYAEVMMEGGAAVKATEWLVFPVAEAGSNSFKVRVQLPPGTTGLVPGMFAKVAFALESEPRLMVPQSAIAYRSELTAVYVATAPQQFRLRQVRLGRRFDQKVEILAGLQAGERIALDPVAAAIAIKQSGAGHD